MQNPIVPVLIVFLTTLILYGVLRSAFKRKPLFNVKPSIAFNYMPKNWSAAQYLAAVTAANIILLVYVACFIKLGLDMPHLYRWLFLGWTSLCTVALIMMYYNVTTRYKKFSSPLNIVAALTTACFAIFTAPLVDSSITELTNMNADKFPAAQKILNLVAVIYCWSLVGGLITMLIFFAVGIHAVSKTVKPARDSMLSMTALVGLSYTFVIYLNAFSEVSSDLSRKRIKLLLVYSSFHLSPEKCGITGQSEETRIALLSDDKAMMAVADKSLTYVFKPVICKPSLAIEISNNVRSEGDGGNPN